MQYFKVNYNKLEYLPQIKFYKFIISIIVLFIILLIISCFINVYHSISTYGIYKDNIVHLKLNNKLSDVVKNGDYIFFNNTKTNYDISYLGDYEIIDNEIYQNIYLTVDKNFIDNEVGLIKFYYHKQKLIAYIFDLFK